MTIDFLREFADKIALEQKEYIYTMKMKYGQSLNEDDLLGIIDDVLDEFKWKIHERESK